MIRVLGRVLPFVMLFSIGLPMRAQEAAKTAAEPDGGTPVFRLQVRRVPVDVVVLDKNGNPVHGLKKSDFVVTEDGKTQNVVSFDVVDASKPGPPLPKVPPLPPNTFTNVPTTRERGPLYILYFDAVNLEMQDQMAFRQELMKFVDNAPEGMRMALFANVQGLHLLQGFTMDHHLLREAILRKGPGPHIPDVFLYGGNYGRSDVGGTLSNLNFIAEYMSGIPGRKNLIWLSGGFPIPVSPTVYGNTRAMASQGPMSFSVGAQGGPQVLDLTELERENIQKTYTAMMKSQIALYPVDVRGAIGALTDYDNEDIIASGTGGHAYYSNNRMSELIQKAVLHGESYYTLTYNPVNPKYEGDERHIQVTLAKKNKDYELTYRRVYYANGEDFEKKQQNKDPLQARFLAAKAQDTLYVNVEHGAPLLHDLLFSAQVTPQGEEHLATAAQMEVLEDAPDYFKTRRKNKPHPALKPVKMQKYVIDYGVIDPQLKAMSARGEKAMLEFAAAAYNDDGRLLNSILNQGVPTGIGGKKSQSLFHAIQELEAPAGTTFIRLAVRDTATDRTGTVEVRLPVSGASSRQQAMVTATAAQ